MSSRLNFFFFPPANLDQIQTRIIISNWLDFRQKARLVVSRNWLSNIVNLVRFFNIYLLKNRSKLHDLRDKLKKKLFVSKSINNDKRRSRFPQSHVDIERSTTHASLIITIATSHNAAGQRINMASMAAVLSRAVGFGKHNVD